ncbi:hypothetical protein PAESOLCIP111_01186 [Paenibacillus solanacearum]|uniref:Extracellular solute-binding protein n=1 Tax=Paenibacillus solanacearum TaxID=2048548 RepID=A0A916NNR0_9BACL|nr:extracellular solute-binding protein [Paenibacillus solanacearum]CAG7609592.1 hypothetical protein PAESOLCIP111_01186 [Paenibacillus solanacearum]
MNRKVWLIGTCMAISVLQGCSTDKGDGNTPGETAAEKPKEPFTMTIYAAGVKAEEFDDRFRGALQKKFPHITFEYKTNGKGQEIADLVTAGTIPDIIRTDVPNLRNNYIDLDLAEDLNPYVKKHQYDLNRFNKVFIDEIVDAGRTGALYGLPVPPYFPHVLYYNKDLFNRFGVPYPKDGMSFDEIYELAKKMSRADGNNIYRGFSAASNSILRDNLFSQPILDPLTDQLANPDRWKAIFSNYKRFYDIPNNPIESTTANETNAFAKGNVAMQVNLHSVYLIIPQEIDWDIVSHPTMEGAPKLTAQRGPAYWSIAKTSKHKDEAFEVITAMLTDEIQMEDSKKGIPATVVNKEIKDALGKGHPLYSTKNMRAISYYDPIPYTPKRKANLPDVPGSKQQALLFQAFLDFAQNKADANTALRKLDEQLKAEVEKEKVK